MRGGWREHAHPRRDLHLDALRHRHAGGRARLDPRRRQCRHPGAALERLRLEARRGHQRGGHRGLVGGRCWGTTWCSAWATTARSWARAREPWSPSAAASAGRLEAPRRARPARPAGHARRRGRPARRGRLGRGHAPGGWCLLRATRPRGRRSVARGAHRRSGRPDRRRTGSVWRPSGRWAGRAAGRGALRPSIVRQDGKAGERSRRHACRTVSPCSRTSPSGAAAGGLRGGLPRRPGAATATSAVLLHWDGRRWKRQPLPWAGDAAALPRSVAVGDRRATSGSRARRHPPISARRGASWRAAAPATGRWTCWACRTTVRSEVMAVAASPRGRLIVGQRGGLAARHGDLLPRAGDARAGAGRAGAEGQPHPGQAPDRALGRHRGLAGGPPTDRGAFVPAGAKVQRLGHPCRRRASSSRTSPRPRAWHR